MGSLQADEDISAEDILNQALGISTNDSLAAALSSVGTNITNETEQLLYASALSKSDIRTMNSSVETQLLMETGTLNKKWHNKKVDNKEDHIIQHDNKLSTYIKSVKNVINNISLREQHNKRDTVQVQVKFGSRNSFNGHDGKAIRSVGTSTIKLVTEASIVADMMSVLFIKLLELDDNDSRIEYLTKVLESPSTWEEGYTSHARAQIFVSHNQRNPSHQRKPNFSSDADIKAAYSNEMKARDFPSNESSIVNSEQTDIFVKHAVQVFMNRLVPPTKDIIMTSYVEAIIEAIESEIFNDVITDTNPYKPPTAPQHDSLLCMLTSEEQNNVRGDIKLALGQFRPTCFTNEDVQSAVGNNIGNNNRPLESQPCFECVLCRRKIGYNSTAKAKDKIISSRLKRDDYFIPHLLSCDEFKKKEREYSLLVKEIEQCKNACSGFTNEMAKRLSRLDKPVPIVYNHQERIAEARKTFELAKEKFGDVNPNHVSLYKIFDNPEFEKLIKYIICHDSIKKNVNFDLDNLRDLFKRLGKVDIYKFRTPDEWKSIFVNKNASRILHEMYLFTLRARQEECAQAKPEEYPIENLRFGGSTTHQSNHIKADGAPPESEEAKSKSFDLASSTCYGKPIIVITDEACKTMFTSVYYHNTGWPWDKPNRAMPDTLYRKEGYSDVVKVVPFSVVQDSDRGRKVHALIDKLVANIEDDSEETYDAVRVTKLVEEATGYDRRDLADFEDKKYDDAKPSEKINILKMIEYYFERREAGGCFMSCCNKRFRNRPRKDFCWFDGHHAKEDSKEDEPSQYHKMSVEQARLERRKCVPLCRPCHIEVHHTPGKEEEFRRELEKEHMVREDDGQIKKLAVEADNDE